MLRRPARLALELALISVTCCWPAVASAQKPGSEVIDPWTPHKPPTRAFPPLPASTWHGPNGSEVINPWRGSQQKVHKREQPFIIDPWHKRRRAARTHERKHAVPTAAFPPLDVVDPWAH